MLIITHAENATTNVPKPRANQAHQPSSNRKGQLREASSDR